MAAHRIRLDILQRELEERAEDLGAQIVKRDTPRIGGSSAGFIALIVCLVLIIVVSCTAIFFLLRNRDPSDAERAARRSRRYAHQSVPSSSSYTYDPSSTPAAKGWLSSLHSFFGRRSGGSTTSNKSRKGARGPGAGWVQASSGDEWDLDPEDDGNYRESRSRGMVGIAQTPLSLSMSHDPTSYTQTASVDNERDPPFKPPRMTTADSASSVRFDDSPITGLPTFDPSTLSTSIPVNLASPVMTPTSSVDADSPKTPNILKNSNLRSSSPEPIAPGGQGQGEEDEEDADKRKKWSAQSDASAKARASGTKFIESL